MKLDKVERFLLGGTVALVLSVLAIGYATCTTSACPWGNPSCPCGASCECGPGCECGR